MDLRLEFGLRVKNLREKKGYSIEFLANVSNLDRTYISEIEKGKRNPSLLVIEKLAKGLEVEILDYFSDVNINFLLIWSQFEIKLDLGRCSFAKYIKE